MAKPNSKPGEAAPKGGQYTGPGKNNANPAGGRPAPAGQKPGQNKPQVDPTKK